METPTLLERLPWQLYTSQASHSQKIQCIVERLDGCRRPRACILLVALEHKGHRSEAAMNALSCETVVGINRYPQGWLTLAKLDTQEPQ